MTASGPALATEALAAALCARIGVEVGSPIGIRLAEACRSATPDRLARAKDSLALPGIPEALAGFFDAATNRETYFFRDRRQIAALSELLTARAARPGTEPVRLWSAGCATGEEAYTLAIVGLRVTAGRSVVQVLGTDVSLGALEEARQGRYRTGPMSPCRDLAADDAAFLPLQPDGMRSVDAQLRRAVRFMAHNLIEGPPSGGRFDAVTCRNVLLYMNPEARRRGLATLAAALVPGGWLLLGPGDAGPMADPATLGFSPHSVNGTILFRREAA